MRTILKIALFTLGLTFASVTYADAYWDADAVYSISKDSPSADLGLGSQRVKSLPIKQVEMWISVRDHISSISGTYTKLLFSDAPVLNAWASNAGGVNTITVTFQMLDLVGDDVDMVAALLGHETTHLARNHMAQQVAANRVFSLLGAIAGAVLEAKLQSRYGYSYGVGQNIGGLGSSLASKAFSRADEREADESGLRWMIQAGYDPQGAIRLHQKLLQISGDRNSFLSDHPSSSDRISYLSKMIAQYKLSQGIQTASESRTTTISPESKPYDSAANDTLPKEVAWGDVKGQVGVALELKERYSYLIFTGTTALKLPVGAKVEIVNNANRRIQGRIARSVDGYYSAVIDGDIHDLEVGDRIEVRGS